MRLEEAMAHWRTHEEPRKDHRTEDELLLLVKEKSEAFDKTIRTRDRREAIAAAIVFVFFSIVLVEASWLTRVGAVIVLVGCVSTYWMLRSTRNRYQAAAGTQPLAAILRAERARVEAQIRLLRRVLWWYISPFAVGLILAFVGAAGASWTSIAYTAAVAAMAGGIYYLNQLAVRRELIPRRDELDRLLRQVDE